MKNSNTEKEVVDLVSVSEVDLLTGLLNRQQFEHHLHNLSNLTMQTNIEHALCHIDIDSFNAINDVHGQAAGDALLCSVTKLIQSCIRQQDVLGRLGGDEFGLIINGCNYDNAIRIANLIRESIKNFEISLGHEMFGVTASIGVAIVNSESEDFTAHMVHAGVACHTAKISGKDRVQVYQDTDRLINSYHDDMKWINKINAALDKNHFQLYAQAVKPIQDDVTENKCACEVLLRLKDKSNEIIAPGKLLAVATRHNMASRIDEWVIENTFIFLQKNVEFMNDHSMIMINLSGQSLGDEKILELIIEKLNDAQFPSSKLCFEITEAATIENLYAAVNFINTVKSKFGCLFALDDFGSGFSSFKYIKELPVDVIKIDGSFVKDMLNDPVSEIMIRSLNDIAQVTNKQTIAEWVEQRAVLDALQHIGVNYAQGFFLGEPLPLRDFVNCGKKA